MDCFRETRRIVRLMLRLRDLRSRNTRPIQWHGSCRALLGAKHSTKQVDSTRAQTWRQSSIARQQLLIRPVEKTCALYRLRANETFSFFCTRGLDRTCSCIGTPESTNDITIVSLPSKSDWEHCCCVLAKRWPCAKSPTTLTGRSLDFPMNLGWIL